ncbi:MAG TPA: hypothetical protein P5205_02015 [Candidatus Paceibacterota bacterium]|nr:hypothetical protein [Verrucomicrobiota bacterium]HSA09122.1 hypothetical protein [Candidatus Paceibacterota bacterium]
MRRNHILNFAKQSCLTLVLAALTLPAFAQQPTAAERAAMLKATLAASQAILRQYQWIETTVVSLKGEEKSRKQTQCYYGADGGVQKVELNKSPEPKKKRGVRGRIAAKKTEELTDYMKNAIALVKSYVPPSPARIQAAKDMGKVSIEILQPGKRARLNFRDYEKSGDNLGVEVDLTNNRPLGLKVSTYLDDADDAVTLDVRMGQLNDGTAYPSNAALDARAKKLKVTVTNSGYRKM